MKIENITNKEVKRILERKESKESQEVAVNPFKHLMDEKDYNEWIEQDEQDEQDKQDQLYYCEKCEKWKPESEMEIRPYKEDGTKGARGQCKKCQRKSSKALGVLHKQYDHTKTDYCWACGRKEGEKVGTRKRTKMQLDHCHETGELRGWLCSMCNVGLYKSGDTLESTTRLLAYVIRAEIRIKNGDPIEEPGELSKEADIETITSYFKTI